MTDDTSPTDSAADLDVDHDPDNPGRTDPDVTDPGVTDADMTDEVPIDAATVDAASVDETSELPPPVATLPAAEPQPRRLRRGASEKIGGVCDGIARYFDLDPTIVRVAFLLFAVAGPGLIVYILLWIFLPAADADPSDGVEKDGRTLLGVLAIGVGFLALTAALGDDFGAITLDFGTGWFLPLALLAVGGWLLLEGPQGSSTSDRRFSLPGYPDAASGGSVPPPPTPGMAMTPPMGQPPGPPVAYEPPPPPEPRSPITPLVLSAIAIGTGIVVAINQATSTSISVTQTLAGAIVLVGVGLAASAFLGRARGLGFVGVMLVLALGVTATVEPVLNGGIGEQADVVTELTSSSSSYEYGIGEYRVDFRRVELTEDHSATIDFGIGELRVLVPNDVNVVVTANLRIGELNALGEMSSGLGNDEVARRIVDEGGPTLTIDVDQFIGEMMVCHGDPPGVVEDGGAVPVPPAPGVSAWVCGR